MRQSDEKQRAGAKRRIWSGLAAGFLFIICVASARADLAFQALFEIVEETPNRFRLSLTVPLVKGGYLKVIPIVPDAFRPQGEPEVRDGAGSLTQSWQVMAGPASLYGEAFGLDGLLGTSQEVRFRLTTLDGRRQETILRSTRSVFIVPPPLAAGQIAKTAARNGVRQAVRHVGMWTMLACILLSSISIQNRIWITLGASFGLIGCWFLLLALPRAGLSDAEVRLMAGFQVTGFAAGTGVAVAVLLLFRSLIPEAYRRWMFTSAFVLWSAWVFYEGTGLVLRQGPIWLDEIQRFAERIAHKWFSPFAADWAMAKLRIPLLSLLTLSLLTWGLFRIKHGFVKFATAGCLLFMALALLPYGVARASVPFLSPTVPSAQYARLIIEPMLSEIYHAFNLEDENETYDLLAERVSGDLVTDIYLDSRRRLDAGTREGASVLVRQVSVQKVDAPLTAGGGGNGLSLPLDRYCQSYSLAAQPQT